MNDVYLIGAVVVGVGIVSALIYNAFRGVRASLTNAKVGEIYNFEYEQPFHGDPERILAKVIEPVHTLSDETIRKLNATSRYRYNDPEFQRTKHLVTCEMPNGDVRNFYAERTRNVRRSVFGGRLFRTAVAAML